MTRANDRVAEALLEYADLLATTGGDGYRVRNYEKAARSVAGYHLDVASLDAEGLDDIPELLDALHEHRLEHVRGFGAKTEQNLLQAIRDHRGSGGRVQLGVALDRAEQMLKMLRALPEVRRSAYAGSLRRMRDTIGDRRPAGCGRRSSSGHGRVLRARPWWPTYSRAAPRARRLSSHLADRHVSSRMAAAVRAVLQTAGHDRTIDEQDDTSATQPGGSCLRARPRWCIGQRRRVNFLRRGSAHALR